VWFETIALLASPHRIEVDLPGNTKVEVDRPSVLHTRLMRMNYVVHSVLTWMISVARVAISLYISD
jgi:hypothetical protein